MSNNKSITDVIGENIGENVLPLESSCSVHFINVGQGDSALIISNNKTILIDAGEVNQDEVVCEYLEKYKIKKIDLLIGT
ncbi:MAG: MBL fold metallo-hydrolase, partial [Oscillospiraceae bacterium]